jgi:hypothetical protein
MAVWDKNWRNGSLKTYDQNYMLNAVNNINDPQVRQELIGSGFLREDGGWNYGSPADAAGAVNAWASGNGLSLYGGSQISNQLTGPSGSGPGNIPTVSFGDPNAWQGMYQAADTPMASRFAKGGEPTPDPNEVTTEIPGGGLPDPNLLAPLLTGQTKTGTPGDPAPGVDGKPVTESPALASTTGAKWNGQDYVLPSGEVLPGSASFTLNIGGVDVKMPGYYDPGSATGGNPKPIFMNGTYPETAMQRFSRRLNDAKNRGENINDPNVIYRELARVRDDSIVALGLQANDPDLAAKLRAGTGFVHLDRFVRGANGETGYTPAPGTGGQPPVPPAPTPTPAPAPGTDPTPTPETTPETTPAPGDANADPTGQFGRNTAYATDEDARNDYVLRQLGIDPDNGGLYLNSILRTIGPALTNFIQLQGISGNTNEGPLQNTEGNLDRFSGWLNGPEGMGGLRNWAQEQMRGVAGPSQGPAGLRDMTDANAQINTLGKLLETSMFGVNPILTQAYADYFDRGRRGYRDYNISQMGKGSITNPIDWLLGSEWGDLING